MKENFKIFIKTYGCQMNERDSESIAAQLLHAGHEIVRSEDIADVVILNTCSVREQAEIKAIGKSGFLSRRKRSNKDFKIGIVGCMAENLGSELFKLNNSIDFVIGPRRLHELPQIIKKCGQTISIGESETRCSAHNFNRNLCKNKCTAFISIMQGCNMRCSYCIVPKTRGNERYRPIDEIVSEAKFLAKNGIKEIMLLGQIVNNFGGKKFPVIDGKTPFVQLLSELDRVYGIERIRYMSPHPTFFTDDLINAHGTLKKLCPYVHLPMQSGSDRILHEMKRPYSSEKILEIVQKLRANVPSIGISTDIIVGYPGETLDDFNDTVSLFDQIKFNMAFVFKYSPRSGTKSAMLPDDVSSDEKERRNRILLDYVEGLSLEYNRQMLGHTVEVLIEGHAKRGGNIMFGWTPNHYKVLVEATDADVGKIVNVKIEDFVTTTLIGEIISQ